MAFVSTSGLLLSRSGFGSAKCSPVASTTRPRRIAAKMNADFERPVIQEIDEQESAYLDDGLRQVEGALFAALIAMGPGSAIAADDGPVKTVFKTKPAALIHPAAMWAIFGGALYTFYLGYKSSTVRKVSAEERKVLVKEKFGEKHFKTSSAIMAVMTIATFEGMANTYTRAGKLFPGPHLYAGLGLVALLTSMSALVPAMQKGESWARDSHFALAFVATGLFAWQAQSGMVIVGKILGWA